MEGMTLVGGVVDGSSGLGGVVDGLGEVVPSSLPPPLLVPHAHDFKQKVKAARFFIKCIRGVQVALEKGYIIRWFTLTESNQAIEQGLDFGKSWNRTRIWLKRKFGEDMGLCVVEHRQGDKERRNWHIVQYGSKKLNVLLVKDYWQEVFLSTVTGMELIKYPQQAVAYVAGYLNDSEKFIKARFSHNWVFPMWFEFSKWYYNMFCEYPSIEYLSKLSLMPIEKRAIDWCFGEFIDERPVKKKREPWVKLKHVEAVSEVTEICKQLNLGI